VRWSDRNLDRGVPHLTPTLSAPRGGEGEFCGPVWTGRPLRHFAFVAEPKQPFPNAARNGMRFRRFISGAMRPAQERSAADTLSTDRAATSRGVRVLVQKLDLHARQVDAGRAFALATLHEMHSAIVSRM